MRRWFDQGLRMSKAETAFMALRSLSRRRPEPAVVVSGCGIAEHRPQRCRWTIAHLSGVDQRLQEIERDREQRRGQSHRPPTRIGASADHGELYA